MRAYVLEHAWLGETDGVDAEVVVEVDGARFAAVRAGGRVPAGATRVPGLTLPGLADTHSHAFHRALRARTADDGGGTFWTWREQMYAVAARLDPDRMHALARATYAELMGAGFTAVGEFHYLHHRPDGTPYDAHDAGAHAMELALAAAAADAGIALTLLDTCYLVGGLPPGPGRPAPRLGAAQVRYGDGDVDAWRRRVDDLAGRLPDDVVLGAAIHSVRAVERADLGAVAAWAAEADRPLHVHLSEQRAENDACRAAWGTTPTGLLAAEGVLGARTTVVHATHLEPDDVRLLGAAGCALSLCPTTERDLADGIGPARAMADAGVRLTIGSDSHAVVDPFEELRATEMHERLASHRRGHFTPGELLRAASLDGYAALGRTGGRIAAGERADLVTLDLATPRTAGGGPALATAVHAATAADVCFVMAGGHERVPLGGAAAYSARVGTDLRVAIAAVHPAVPRDDAEVER